VEHRGKLSEFEAYLKDRQEKTSLSRSEIERNGTEAALDRCRELALRIQSELSSRSAEDFVDLLALADFQVSIERAACAGTPPQAEVSSGVTRLSHLL
jgi:hypothetical protein